MMPVVIDQSFCKIVFMKLEKEVEEMIVRNELRMRDSRKKKRNPVTQT